MKKNLILFLGAVILYSISVACGMNHPTTLTTQQGACLEDCNKSREGIIQVYDECVETAIEAANVIIDQCLAGPTDERIACLQLARQALINKINQCKAERTADLGAMAGCDGKCLLAEPLPRQ